MASPTNHPLWKHQADAVKRATSLNDFALFFEMGTGKTRTTIEILREKFIKEKRLMRTLILCPPIVIANWRREILENSRIGDHDIIPLVGPQRDRCMEVRTRGFYQEKLRDKQIPKIFITNYEFTTMIQLVIDLHAWRPEVLVLDESHKIKDPKAKRSVIVYDFAERATARFLLTGTPVLNSPKDLFHQFKCLDKGDTFGLSHFNFLKQYFYDKNAWMPKQKHFPDWVVKPGALEEMSAKIAAKSMRITKAECLDLPPLVIENFYVELSVSQRKLYDEMKADFITFINDKACVATLAITKALRLMQIASGFITVEGVSENENITIEDNPRAKMLKDLLEEITPNSKVLVWAVFKENYKVIRHICEVMGIGFVEITGEVSPSQKQENLDRFNSDPDCRVLIGNPASGGIGINLTVSDVAIFYSRNFSLENDLQAEARNHRGGSEVHKKITRINIIATKTIDEVISKALAEKVQVGEKILRDMVGAI